MTLDCYLRLLDRTGRQMRCDKRGAIPDELAPILTRLQVGAETWLESVQHFGRRFGRAVGAPAHVQAAAERAGKRWFQGVAHCRMAPAAAAGRLASDRGFLSMTLDCYLRLLDWFQGVAHCRLAFFV